MGIGKMNLKQIFASVIGAFFMLGASAHAQAYWQENPQATITASTTATTGAFNASLAAVFGKTNYICGFVITSGGTTAAAVVNATVAGTVSGTMNFSYVFPSSGQGVLGVAFPQCIIASASNTAITVSVPAGGTGTTAALSVWGYRQ